VPASKVCCTCTPCLQLAADQGSLGTPLHPALRLDAYQTLRVPNNRALCLVTFCFMATTQKIARVSPFSTLVLGAAVAAGPNAPPSAAADASPVVSAAPYCNLADFQAELLRRVNALRAEEVDCGEQGRFAPAVPLTWNEALAKAAEGHSRDMGVNDYLEHVARNGSTPAARVDAQGYAWSMVAENIAGGQLAIADVVDSWRRSPGHCANLMRPGLREVGVACVRASGTRYRLYWTMVLGTPRQL
jgi:uncharacterized protein YkwD